MVAGKDDVSKRPRRSAANPGEDGQIPIFTTAKAATPSTGVLDSEAGFTRRRRPEKQHVLTRHPDQKSSQIGSDAGHKKMPTTASTATYNPQWAVYALLSGAFAAFNGVFAKLTSSPTTSSTVTPYLTTILPFLSPDILSVLIRGAFFVLNLVSNAIMWTLFTKALTQHPSSTKVSIVNTSFNFGITAVLGWAVFSEKFGGVLGACGLACLAVGCVILGSGKDGQSKPSASDKTELSGLQGTERESVDEYRDEVDGQAQDAEGKDELDFKLEDEDARSTSKGKRAMSRMF